MDLDDYDDDDGGGGSDGGSAHAAGLSLLTRRLVTTADEVGAGFELLAATEGAVEVRARKRQRRETHTARIAKQAGRGGLAVAAAASDDELDVGDDARAALSVRGYGCAFVRDDAAAAHVDAWRHLVPLGDAAAPVLGAVDGAGSLPLPWRGDEADVIVLGRRPNGESAGASSTSSLSAALPPSPDDDDAVMVDRFDGRLLLGRGACAQAAAATGAAVDVSDDGSLVDEPADSDSDPPELRARLQHERYRDLHDLERRAARAGDAASDDSDGAADGDDVGGEASAGTAPPSDAISPPPQQQPSQPSPSLPTAFPGPMELPFDRHPLPPALARLPPSVHPLLYRVLVTTARRVAAAPALEPAMLQRQAVAEADPRFEFLGAGHPLRPLYDALKTRARRCPDDGDWPEPAPVEGEQGGDDGDGGGDAGGSVPSVAVDGSRPAVRFALAAGTAGTAVTGSDVPPPTTNGRITGRITGLVAYDSDDDDDDDDSDDDGSGHKGAPPGPPAASTAAADAPAVAVAEEARVPVAPSPAPLPTAAPAPAAEPEVADQRAAALAAAKQRALEAVARLAAAGRA
jgi:hypothetical protein